MSFESDVSAAAFAAFATAATVDGAALASGAVVDRNVEVQDEYGEVRYVGAVVRGMKSELEGWSKGDLVVHDRGQFRLQELVDDDGEILSVAATPSPTA